MNKWSIRDVQAEEIDIHGIVAGAVAAASHGLQGTRPAVLEPDTCIYGRNGFMDSVGLVALVLEIERQLEERHGMTLPIMDDKAFSRQYSPFRSLGTLETYVRERIKDVYGEGPDCSN